MTIDQLLAGIVTLVVSFLGVQGTKFLTAKINQVKELTKNQTVKNALESVEGTVADVVYYMKTTMVDQIKEKSADGKLTKEEIQEILVCAKNRISSIVKEDSLEILSATVNDVDAWLDNKIEKHVELTKRAN